VKRIIEKIDTEERWGLQAAEAVQVIEEKEFSSQEIRSIFEMDHFNSMIILWKNRCHVKKSGENASLSLIPLP
jgi:hypothetical protein